MTASAHTAFPADGFTAAWTSVRTGDAELVTLRWENEAWTASIALSAARVELVVRLSPLWQVRQLLLFRDLDEPDLWLGTDGRGGWGEVNGTHRTDLDGAVDIAASSGGSALSAFVHTVPIRRIPVDVGGSFDTRVIDVDVETLGVEPVLRTYRRTDRSTWEVAEAGDVVTLTVDEHGLPLDIAGFARRTG